MKVFLKSTLAVALMACALAFTACEEDEGSSLPEGWTQEQLDEANAYCINGLGGSEEQCDCAQQSISAEFTHDEYAAALNGGDLTQIMTLAAQCEVPIPQ